MVKSTDRAESNNQPVDLSENVEAWLEELHQADATFYSMMSMEIWSIAQTMDEISPGFWSQFMRNRQAIVKQQIQAQQRRYDEAMRARKLGASAARLFSPLSKETDAPAVQNALGQLDLFSETLSQEFPGRKTDSEFG
jgi:hypothetical protein